MADGKKVIATGGWTFIVEPQFEVLNDVDFVQAVHGDRVVYVRSLSVRRPEALVPAAQLRMTAAMRFIGLGEHFAHVGDSVQGDAEILIDGDAWRLRGTMCADGTVAICEINFRYPHEQAWAVSVWKSLSCTERAH